VRRRGVRRVRRRTMAALRKEAEPVPPRALAMLLPAWQSVGRAAASPLRGVDGVLRVVEQLAGAVVPASALEKLILPTRVADYSPAMLDELTSSGEVVWAGAGRSRWTTAGDALPGRPRAAAVAGTRGVADLSRSISASWRRSARTPRCSCAGSWPAAARRARRPKCCPALGSAVGRLRHQRHAGTAPRAARLREDRAQGARPTPRGPYAGLGRAATSAQSDEARAAAISPSAAGRWSRLPQRVADPTRRAHVLGEALLDRYGVVTRGSVMSEGVPAATRAVYSVLSVYEEAGRPGAGTSSRARRRAVRGRGRGGPAAVAGGGAGVR